MTCVIMHVLQCIITITQKHFVARFLSSGKELLGIGLSVGWSVGLSVGRSVCWSVCQKKMYSFKMTFMTKS